MEFFLLFLLLFPFLSSLGLWWFSREGEEEEGEEEEEELVGED